MSAEPYDRPRLPLIVPALGVGVGVVALFVAIARRRRAAASVAPEQPEQLQQQPPPAQQHADDGPAFRGPAPTNEVEALARVLASEVGANKKNPYTMQERLVVGWAVRNRARHRKTTIIKLVCSPTCGRCCKGRPFSSYEPPTQADLDLARDILSRPQSDDPTTDAGAFFEPALQDFLVAHGDPLHHRTADQVRARWLAAGQRQLGTVGRIELWS
jgi:hypothetical protein